MRNTLLLPALFFCVNLFSQVSLPFVSTHTEGNYIYQAGLDPAEDSVYLLLNISVAPKGTTDFVSLEGVSSLFYSLGFKWSKNHPLWGEYFFIGDVNFDGYADFYVRKPLALTAGMVGPEVVTWLFNPLSGQFELCKNFDGLQHPAFNAAKKEITCYEPLDDSCRITHYRCVDNRPVLTNSKTISGDVFHLDSIALVFSHTINGCSDEREFMTSDHRRYFLKGAEAPFAGTTITVLPEFPYTTIELKSRFATAYGIRMSETEGVVFYDTTLHMTDSGAVRPRQDNGWYAFSRAHLLMPRNNETFSTTSFNREWQFASSPKPRHAKQADAFLRAHYASLYDTTNLGPADDPVYRKQLLSFHQTQLYYYLEELEIVIYGPGGVVRKTLVLFVRHGEC